MPASALLLFLTRSDEYSWHWSVAKEATGTGFKMQTKIELNASFDAVAWSQTLHKFAPFLISIGWQRSDAISLARSMAICEFFGRKRKTFFLHKVDDRCISLPLKLLGKRKAFNFTLKSGGMERELNLFPFQTFALVVEFSIITVSTELACSPIANYTVMPSCMGLGLSLGPGSRIQTSEKIRLAFRSIHVKCICTLCHAAAADADAM